MLEGFRESEDVGKELAGMLENMKSNEVNYFELLRENQRLKKGEKGRNS